MKKIIALSTAVSMAVSVFPFVALASNALPFDDVPPDYMYAEAIINLNENGIVQGYPDGTFKPENMINRAELAKILVESVWMTPSAEEYGDCFPDVKSEWFAPYVCFAKEQNWIQGYPDGTFKPEQNVNKVEAIKMIFNAHGVGPIPSVVEEDPFVDVPADSWFAGYVKKAQSIDVLEERGIFLGPEELMSRARMCELLYRTRLYLSYVKDVYLPLGEYDNVVYEEAFVERVIDGDTIEVTLDGTKEKVRLLGIDVPEADSDDCFNAEATAYLESLLLDEGSSEVLLTSDPMNDNRDKYGRLLRYVSNDYGDAGILLLKGGYVLYYGEYPFLLSEDYAAAELEAQGNVAGLWHACQSAE